MEKCKTENVSVHTLCDSFIHFLPVLVLLCIFIYCEAGITLEVVS